VKGCNAVNPLWAWKLAEGGGTAEGKVSKLIRRGEKGRRRGSESGSKDEANGEAEERSGGMKKRVVHGKNREKQGSTGRLLAAREKPRFRGKNQRTQGIAVYFQKKKNGPSIYEISKNKRDLLGLKSDKRPPNGKLKNQENYERRIIIVSKQQETPRRNPVLMTAKRGCAKEYGQKIRDKSIAPKEEDSGLWGGALVPHSRNSWHLFQGEESVASRGSATCGLLGKTNPDPKGRSQETWTVRNVTREKIKNGVIGKWLLNLGGRNQIVMTSTGALKNMGSWDRKDIKRGFNLGLGRKQKILTRWITNEGN